MPSFEVAKQERFPDQLSGIVVPDDGYKTWFYKEIEDYYGRSEPLVALFVYEFSTTLSLHYLENAVELANLQGIVTFGRLLSIGQNDSRTHLEIIARELALPLLQLQRPDCYSNYTMGSYDDFLDGWVKNNPLKDLYRKQVSVDILGNTATIEAVS
jgi:hypothetical protein